MTYAAKENQAHSAKNLVMSRTTLLKQSPILFASDKTIHICFDCLMLDLDQQLPPAEPTNAARRSERCYKCVASSAAVQWLMTTVQHANQKW